VNASDHKAFAIIAPCGDLRLRTRLAKFARVFHTAGASVSHIAWRRDNEATGTGPVTWTTDRVLTGGAYDVGLSLGAAKGYVSWILSVWRWARKADPVPSHCLGLESALPVLLAGRKWRQLVILDEADRMSLSHQWPTPLRKVLVALERWVYRRVRIHIVPSSARYKDSELDTARLVVLENLPDDQAIAQSREIQVPSSEGKFTILCAGWLGATRGAEQILFLADALLAVELPQVRLVLAGRYAGESAEKLIGHPCVEYLGELPQPQVLALSAQASCLLTIYDPSIPINRYALANKWGDALAMGVPFIVNREVTTARHFVEAGIAFDFEYARPQSLVKLVAKLQSEPALLQAASKAASQRFEMSRSFDDIVHENVIEEFYGEQA